MMRSLEAKGKEREELEEAYNNLERDWNAYKQSKSRTWRPCCCTDSGSITVKAIQLLHNSPRHLISQLQGCTTEIAAVDGGKLKGGRRLFEEAMVAEGGDEMRRVVRSLSFCDSEDEGDGRKGSSHSSSSSSSLPPFVSGEEEAKVNGAKNSVCVARDREGRSKINGGRYIVMLGFGIALLIIFAICMRSATSYGGFEGILVPT